MSENLNQIYSGRSVDMNIRTSTENQKESIRLQTEELIAYSKSHNYEIYDKYIDLGVSGNTTERPALNTLLEDAKVHKFDMVLVTKIDRFARSILDCLLNIKKLQEYDVQFAATSQPIDTSSAMGKLTLNIMAAFADFEREIIRERMETGRKAAEKRGVVCNRPRKEISKKMALNYIETGLSATATAKTLKVDPATIVKRLNEWGYVYENGKWMYKEREI
jgi:DNA invertase Pin-like site-specific DNA recombinase